MSKFILSYVILSYFVFVCVMVNAFVIKFIVIRKLRCRKQFPVLSKTYSLMGGGGGGVIKTTLYLFFFFFFFAVFIFLLILHKLQNTTKKTLQILTNANITQVLLLTITLTLTNYNY